MMKTETFYYERDVEIPLRDGVITRADVYRPVENGSFPTILVRIPYNKAGGTYPESIDPLVALSRGYAVVYQDTRGRYASEGDFSPFTHEAIDGFDTVEWLAAQPWCDGNVGMTGFSYTGAVQWLAAAQRPPALKAIIPMMIGSRDFESQMSHVGGAFKLGYLLWWAPTFVAGDQARRKLLEGGQTPSDIIEQVIGALDHYDETVAHRPLTDVRPWSQLPVLDFYFKWLSQEFGGEAYPQQDWPFSEIDLPVLSIGGWFDYFLQGTIDGYSGMLRMGRSKDARDQQRLLIGPWSHIFGSVFNGFSYGFKGSALGFDLNGIQLDHFDRYLKIKPAGDADWKVKIFVMGTNVWREEPNWPLERTAYTPWYFTRSGNIYSRQGLLTKTEPGSQSPDTYLYEPWSPAPTIGGPTGLPGLAQGTSVGPLDQRPNEQRADVMVYTSELIYQPLEVTGPVDCVLYARSTAPSTDFIVRLCDVFPDGTSRLLTEGVIRTDSPRVEEADGAARLSPQRLQISMAATSNVFLPGHRIRIDVTSSSFPWIEPNPNTGNPTGTDRPSDLRATLQEIHHDSEFPSHVVLPLIPQDGFSEE